MKLIQTNVLQDGSTKSKKLAKGEFAKKYVSIDKNGKIPAERFHGSKIVQAVENQVREVSPRKINTAGPSKSVRAEKNDLLSQYFNQKKNLK